MTRYDFVRGLLKKECYGQVHPLFCRACSPAKEITESFAAFHHLYDVIEDMTKLQTFFHIGDGAYCRTGALFTFLLGLESKSIHVSVDPAIKYDFMTEWIKDNKVKNFFFHADKWQDIDLSFYPPPYTFVLVHAHVNLESIAEKYPFDFIYTNPCCHYNKQVLSINYIEKNRIGVVKAGNDLRNLSEKNFFIIYKGGEKKYV